MSPLLLLLILVITPRSCVGIDGCVWPKDQHVEAGSSMEVVCDRSCVTGEISWLINNRRADKSLSRAINSTHVLLSLRSVAPPMAVVECFSVNIHQSVGGAIFRTYTKPRNLSCMLHYDSGDGGGVPQLLTCTWEHHMDAPVRVNYTLLFVSSSHHTFKEICKSNVTTCTVKDIDISEDVNFSIGDNFTMKVRARTQQWEAYSDSYEFHPYHILKINPPKFNVSAFSDHLVVESTELPRRMKLHCQVRCSKISSPDEQNTEWIYNKTVNAKQKLKLRTEDELDSCSNYTLSVRCTLLNGPWSDWSREKTVVTKLNRSQIRLRLWRKVTEVQSDGGRKVRAMWQDIPSMCEGTFTYAIQQTPHKEHTTGVEHNYTVCRRSPCDVDVDRDTRNLNVIVFRNEERLTSESIYVPAVGESLPQVTDIQTSSRDGVILVSWRAPARPVRGYMIDWTDDGDRYDWEESEHTNATLLELHNKGPFDITVTPLFDNETGHGSRVLRICSRLDGPGIVSIISFQAYDKSADVSWDTKSLGPCSGDVVSYTVHYRAQEGPLLNVTVDSTKQEAFLKDLDPDTQYRVYVEATALTGTATSRERLFKTKKFDPNLLTVLITSGSLIIVLVLSLGLCCAIQWKKFRDKPVPNPGLSSVALWPPSNHQKATCLFLPFSNPSESTCDRVYTAETPHFSHPSPATTSNSNAAGERGEECADSAVVQDGKPADPVETQHPGSSQESTALLSFGSSPVSPYRSQTSVETQASQTGKQSERSPVRDNKKTLLKTVYVTLEMFEHDQPH